MADPLDSPPITSIDPTQELTIYEIVSREIDPVLFILLLSTVQFPSNGLMVNCHVSYAVNNYLVKSILPASHPYRNDSVPPVTPFPIGTGGGA